MYTFAKFSLALVTFHGLMGNNISAIPHRLNKANKSYFYPGEMEFFAPCCFPSRAAIKSTRFTTIVFPYQPSESSNHSNAIPIQILLLLSNLFRLVE